MVHCSHLNRLLYIAHFCETYLYTLHYLTKKGEREHVKIYKDEENRHPITSRGGKELRQEKENINEIFSANRSLFYSDSNLAKEELFTSNRKQANKPQQHCTSFKRISQVLIASK